MLARSSSGEDDLGDGRDSADGGDDTGREAGYEGGVESIALDIVDTTQTFNWEHIGYFTSGGYVYLYMF